MTPADSQDTITTGELCVMLGFQITYAFIVNTLDIRPARSERNGWLWRRADVPLICERLASHVTAAGAKA